MTTAETVESLMAEMGPVLDPLLIESFSDPACWGPRLYEQLLVHNHRWEQQGGLRMALDQPGGNVVLMQDLAIEGLDVTRLCSALTAFAASAKALREAMTASAPEFDLGGQLVRPAPSVTPGAQV